VGIWWALHLVGLLDERNVVEWSVLRCSGCRVLICGAKHVGVSCLYVMVGAILSISCVLTCGRCVLLMV
jgi:hypothetical protein